MVIYVTGQHEQKEDVMRLLLNTFHYLSEGSRSAAFLKPLFEMRFMTEIGMMPDIVCCASCMKYAAEEMYFDLMSTKLYCVGCITPTKDDTLVKFRLLSYMLCGILFLLISTGFTISDYLIKILKSSAVSLKDIC